MNKCHVGDASCIPDSPGECEKQGISENYWKYLVVSTVLLIIVYVPVVLSSTSISVYRVFQKAQRRAEEVERGILRPVKSTYKHSKLKFIKEMALGEHYVGKTIIAISLLVNLAYFALYWRRTYLLSEICLDQYDPEWKLEVIFTVYFILHLKYIILGHLLEL